MSSSLVIGGAGTLGKAIVKTLQKNGTRVISLDFNNNIDANHNIIMISSSCHKERLQYVNSEIKKLANTKFNSIFSVAGSWRGGSISDDDFMENIESMNKANLEPACMAAHLSTKQLTSDGLLVLTGAAAILDGGQPGMIGYGVSKISTHYLATSMAESFKNSQKSVLTVCPTTIDTPSNRSAMPNANFDSWTKPEEISEKCMNWVNDITSRPKSGSLLRVDGSGKSLKWS